MYTIYSLTPAPWGTSYRYVETFDTEEDAKKALATLESVNISFKCYEIVPEAIIFTNKQLRVSNANLRRLLRKVQTVLEVWNPAIEQQFTELMTEICKALGEVEEEVEEEEKDIVERLNETADVLCKTHSAPQEPQVSLMREAAHEIVELRSLISAMREGR